MAVDGCDIPSIPEQYSTHFGEVGLILRSPVGRLDYYCTPVSCCTFGVTGVDGVHFSLLAIDGDIEEDSPIVMTVPMAFDQPNVVVGDNLHDFLCLGCRVGYSVLAQIAGAKAHKLVDVGANSYSDDLSPSEIAILTLLSADLRLKPWSNPEHRLMELAREYLPALRLPVRNDQ
jgi:hypothetical protein